MNDQLLNEIRDLFAQILRAQILQAELIKKLHEEAQQTRKEATRVRSGGPG